MLERFYPLTAGADLAVPGDASGDIDTTAAPAGVTHVYFTGLTEFKWQLGSGGTGGSSLVPGGIIFKIRINQFQKVSFSTPTSSPAVTVNYTFIAANVPGVEAVPPVNFDAGLVGPAT